ncbi:hypothetical protein HPB52_023549 [Rhipicephalus sanguineus]|uniref:Sulfatase N-terminal domain-containing protein n=1 Tax=Rhipicephalus sanguineus TaxID=34632 RepID=A0A9D4PHM3_RHISA|nr:hypothetical protein HPB52_023549 [Rhipicephalus sanguineus]
MERASSGAFLYEHRRFQGWADVGHHGSRQLLTPNIDWLAADGLALAQHYAQSSSTATRSALLTGLYPIHTGE